MNPFTRRRFLQATGAAALTAPLANSLLLPTEAHAQAGKVLTPAYNLALPSWDPTPRPSAGDPPLQSIYKAGFGSYIHPDPGLSFKPGRSTKWGVEKSTTRR